MPITLQCVTWYMLFTLPRYPITSCPNKPYRVLTEVMDKIPSPQESARA